VHIPFRVTLPEPRFGITKEIFLQKIGKGCSEYADKFQSWEELMTLKGQTLKKREIPVKARRWILNWVEKYKQGEEPRGVRFASIAEKNKEKKKERFEKHKEDFAKRVARKLYERNQEKQKKRHGYN